MRLETSGRGNLVSLPVEIFCLSEFWNFWFKLLQPCQGQTTSSTSDGSPSPWFYYESHVSNFPSPGLQVAVSKNDSMSNVSFSISSESVSNERPRTRSDLSESELESEQNADNFQTLILWIVLWSLCFWPLRHTGDSSTSLLSSTQQLQRSPTKLPMWRRSSAFNDWCQLWFTLKSVYGTVGTIVNPETLPQNLARARLLIRLAKWRLGLLQVGVLLRRCLCFGSLPAWVRMTVDNNPLSVLGFSVGLRSPTKTTRNLHTGRMYFSSLECKNRKGVRISRRSHSRCWTRRVRLSESTSKFPEKQKTLPWDKRSFKKKLSEIS